VLFNVLLGDRNVTYEKLRDRENGNVRIFISLKLDSVDLGLHQTKLKDIFTLS
jgi:hypothetical protein